MALFANRKLRWTLLVLIALIVVVLSGPVWLRALGHFLVRSDAPMKADMIVVLGGDDHGNRILKAAELIHQGYAPKALVSGPYCCYGNVESDLAIAYAVRKGCPREWFISFPFDARSTVEEARIVKAELDRRGVHRFLLVTSNYHTRRAGSIFRKVVPAERFRVIAARDWCFNPDDWWRNRDAQKQWFFEATKTLATWAGL